MVTARCRCASEASCSTMNGARSARLIVCALSSVSGEKMRILPVASPSLGRDLMACVDSLINDFLAGFTGCSDDEDFHVGNSLSVLSI